MEGHAVVLPLLLLLLLLELLFLPFPFPLALTLAFADVVGGGGKRGGVSEDSTVLTEVGVEEEEDALLLRVQIRTWRPVLGPPSCPVQSPRVQGCCRWCGRRGTTVSAWWRSSCNWTYCSGPVEVKNEVTIGEDLTQYMKVVDYALHPATVFADTEVALLEDAEFGIEL
jgi:hypothetical protein